MKSFLDRPMEMPNPNIPNRNVKQNLKPSVAFSTSSEQERLSKLIEDGKTVPPRTQLSTDVTELARSLRPAVTDEVVELASQKPVARGICAMFGRAFKGALALLKRL